jgi:hypothetical protein
MSGEPSMSNIVQSAASPAPPGQRWFWLAGALLAALVVFVGFSPTFYLRNLFDAPQLSTLKLVHGIVFSAWVVLFVAQTSLVATNRRDTHRALGAFGALLLVAMCLVGYRMAIESGRSGFTPDPAKVSALSFMAVPLFDLAVFALLVSAALLLRARSDWHKRLMLIATLSLLPPAIARVAMQFPPLPVLPIAFGGTALLIVAAIVLDRVTLRRLHPAALAGGLIVILSLPARLLIGSTQAWQDLAAWLIA